MKTGILNKEQVVDYLLNRKQNLQETIHRMNIVINGIETLHNKERPSPFNKSTLGKILEPVEKFEPQANLDQKIGYALYQLGNGFKEDILEVLAEAQPEADPRKIKNALAVRLSLLLKSGCIQARKIGRRYEYGLYE